MTTQTKFTPGPWIANGSVVRAAHDCVAASRLSASCDSETQHANAALIAAAPDMYRELQRLVTILTDDNDQSWYVSEARKALAKAEGRS